MPVVDRNETSSERRNIQVDLWVLDVFETRAREVDYAAAACRGRHCESRQRKHNSFAQIQNKQLDAFCISAVLFCSRHRPSRGGAAWRVNLVA